VVELVLIDQAVERLKLPHASQSANTLLNELPLVSAATAGGASAGADSGDAETALAGGRTAGKRGHVGRRQTGCVLEKAGVEHALQAPVRSLVANHRRHAGMS